MWADQRGAGARLRASSLWGRPRPSPAGSSPPSPGRATGRRLPAGPAAHFPGRGPGAGPHPFPAVQSAHLGAPPPSPRPRRSRTRSAGRGRLASCDAGARRCHRPPPPVWGAGGNEVVEPPLGCAPSPPFPGVSVLSAAPGPRVSPTARAPEGHGGQRRLGTAPGRGPSAVPPGPLPARPPPPPAASRGSPAPRLRTPRRGNGPGDLL